MAAIASMSPSATRRRAPTGISSAMVGDVTARPSTSSIATTGTSATSGSERTPRMRGTGTAVSARAAMMRPSRATSCADDASAPIGGRRTTTSWPSASFAR